MPEVCNVPNCHQKSKNVFHSPHSRPNLELWKRILGMTVDDFYVCEHHFEDKFFRIHKRLTAEAFPTQFLGDIQPGSDDFCQCCMKSFVRSKFITQTELRMQIDGNFQKDFEEIIGCEIPPGVACKSCFDSIKNFKKFRNDIREKQKVREELRELTMQSTSNSVPFIKIKEEPKDPEELCNMPQKLNIKTEESLQIGTDNFLISEIKVEPEELQEPDTVKISVPKPKTVVIKRFSGSVRPVNLQSLKASEPQKVVKVIRPPVARISNAKGTIQAQQSQLDQMENSKDLLGYKCQYCPNRFIERRFIVDHIKEKHTFPCGMCTHIFPFKITLLKHQMAVHSNEGSSSRHPNYKFVCSRCGLRFMSRSTLESHVEQHHKKTVIEEKKSGEDSLVVIRPTQLPTVKPVTPIHTRPIIIRKPSTLTIQPSTSSNPKPTINLGQTIRIKVEPKNSESVTSLVKKILLPCKQVPPPEPVTEDPDGIPCLDCGLLMQPDKLLKHRIDAHDLDTHNLVYECDLCGGKVRGKTLLIKHMTTMHMSGKYQKCDYCEAVFESQTDLVCHKNSQHNFNGTRFRCYFCGQVFGSKREMTVHRKAHYSEKESREKMARVFCKRFKSYEPKGSGYK